LYFLTHDPLKKVRTIAALEQSLRAEQDPVSEILRLFLVWEIFPFPPIRRFQIYLHINPPIGGDGDTVDTAIHWTPLHNQKSLLDSHFL
jgi:hypothetical protein